MRIASLIASSTEMVYALGRQADLVGRSHECDFPASVRALPVLTEPKFVVEGSSAEIDARVKELLKDALSVYRVFPEALARVRPDVILTQTQCEVCAVSEKDVQDAVCTLWAAGDDRVARTERARGHLARHHESRRRDRRE
jgi:iron complex transport system substrate-binding protein